VPVLPAGRRRLALAAVLTAALCAALPATSAGSSAARAPVDASAGSAGVAGPSSPAAPEGRRLVIDGRGRTRLVGAPPGRRLAVAPAGVRDPAATARSYLRRHRGLFGLRAGSGLRTVSVIASASGHDVVRLQQTVAGLPVLGGQLVAVLDRSADLVSVGGEVTRRVRTSSYDVAASRAARLALRVTATAHGVPARDLHAVRPSRWLYDASLVDPRGADGARAAWRVEVTAPRHLDVRELVLVDAATGTVAMQVDQVAHVLDRVVCDNADTVSRDHVCRPGEYARAEGAPPSGISDVDQAYDLTGVTAAWYAATFGVDLTALIGNDRGDGRKLRSTTRWCQQGSPCPLPNAFWSGDQMVYGSGFAAADDVVAHELTHGVTQATASLLYWYQSGAINESMSDVFGELVDLAAVTGADTPDTRWQLGEDLVPRLGGVARDMSDPPAYGQPDHTGSDLYDVAPDYDDNGGVHTNSGVPNKTAYLVVDGTVAEPGGAFNGRSFPGIGPDKAAAVYWAALQMLTPGSDFADLSAALGQACANLAAVAAVGVTPVDCQTVTAAGEATGLTRWVSPSEPRNVSMVPGAGTVSLSWDPPATSGSSPRSSYVVHLRPAVGKDDFFPLEPSARDFRLEGLVSGTAYTVGVVAVSADGTSPSVVRSFGASAVRVTWPGSVLFESVLRVRGVLTGTDGVPSAGRVVRLLRRYSGRSAYERVASATTRATGSFTLTARPRRGASYAVLYPGSAGELGARSVRRVVPVRQRVGVQVDTTLRLGRLARFSGGVRPERPGAPVRLQRQVGSGRWRTLDRGQLTAGSRYRLVARPTARRADSWRVVVPEPPRGGLAAGISRAVRITVR